VPIDQYEPGFPFLDLTKRMPKRKRKWRQLINIRLICT
jgi:hypothetical protein